MISIFCFFNWMIFEINNGIYIIRLLSKETAEDISISAAISNSLSDREVERISTLIPEVLESKAEIVDNRSLYY